MSREQIEQFLSSHEELVRPIVLSGKGKVVKNIGDSFMATFESPTNAVLTGIEIQKAAEEYNKQAPPETKMEIRISINVGEVTKRGRDVFGEAVNIASRLLSVAENGEVYFTEAVYLVMNKTEVPTAEVGYRQFKGVPEKVRVYRVLRETPSSIVEKKEEQVLPEAPVEEKPVEEKKKSFSFLAVGLILLAFLSLIALFAATKVEEQNALIQSRAALTPRGKQIKNGKLLSTSVVHDLKDLGKVQPRQSRVVALPARREKQPAQHHEIRKTEKAPRIAEVYIKPLTHNRKSPTHRDEKKKEESGVQHVRLPFVLPQNITQPENNSTATPEKDFAVVFISSDPVGASIIADGKVMGNTDTEITLQPGEHTIVVRKPGYGDYIFPVTLLPDEYKRLLAHLRPARE